MADTTPAPDPAQRHIYDDKQFRALIDQSIDAIQLVTPEGVVLHSSDSVENVLGYKPAEIEGVNVSPYLHPDDVKIFGVKWTKVLAKHKAQATLEYRVKHKNGSWVWVETTITNHLATPGIEAILGNFRNITERKATEDRLRQSEEQYRQLVELSPEAIAVHSGGNLVYINAAGARMIGAKSAKQLIGKPVMQFVHPDSVPLVIERIKQMLVEKKPTELVQERFVRLDGVPIDVEVISIPVTYKGEPGIQIVVREITDAKRAAEELKASEERLRFMAESMPQKIYTATPEGKVDYCNPQWFQYSGLTDTELYDQGWEAIIHPDDFEDNMERWKHSVKTGDPFAMEQRFRRYDGEYRWHISRAKAMRDKQGNIVRWFGSNTDIDDIKRSLEREHELEKRTIQLTEQRAQLVALNKAKDEFIALASHQLRTPATAVKQYLGMALGGYGGDISPQLAEMINLANVSNERQIKIINDLLEVARLDAGKVELKLDRTDLLDLLRQVIAEQTSSITRREQKVHLENVKDASPLMLTIDSTKIRMALENILHNASKYSPPKTDIRITIKKRKDRLCVAITDTGVGIESEDMKKLFRKFSRLGNPLSEVVGGTGLGLYWAKRIIDLHGGDIEVQSEPGKGSTFTICLPTHQPKGSTGN